MAARLRHVFIHHGDCTPMRRLGDSAAWQRTLPTMAALEELHRRTVILPRPGDGWYAPPSTGVSDGFPWGQLTAQGLERMLNLGKSGLGPEAHPERIFFRAPGVDAAIQSAQALALGMSRAAGNRTHVSEIFLQRGEELEPAVRLGEAGFPTAQAGEVAASLIAEARSLIRTDYPNAFDSDAAPSLGDICEALTCLGTDAPLSRAVGDLAFAHASEPFRRDPKAADIVLGPLLREVAGALQEAVLEEPEEPTRVYVVPAETMVILGASFGLAPEVSSRSAGSPLGAWPVRGARLEMELVAEGSGIRFHYNGVEASETSVPWASFEKRFSTFLE